MTINAPQAAARIREALEAGPTPGDWMYQGTQPWSDPAGAFSQWGSYAVSANTLDQDGKDYYFVCGVSNVNDSDANKANAALIAACSPGALRALLAERDELLDQMHHFANADQRLWDEGLRGPESFKSWVQSRAAHLLAKFNGPAVTPKD